MTEKAGHNPIRAFNPGVLKRILVGLLMGIFLGCGTLLLALYLFGGWNRDATPWSRLPPGTQWALHIHDAAALGKAAARDKGIRSLLSSKTSLAEILDSGALPELPQQPASGAPKAIVSPAIVAAYRYFGGFHRLIAPNSIVAGATFREPDAVFAIAQPTAWMRFLLKRGKGKYSEIQTTTRFSEDEVFYVEKDGWVIFSTIQEAVQEVLDGWNSGAVPMGEGSMRQDTHAYFAARSKPARISSAQTFTPTVDAPASHFTLGDPFAVAMSSTAPESGLAQLNENDAYSCRILLQPESGGWLISGDGGKEKRIADNPPFDVCMKSAEGYDVTMYAVMEASVKAALEEHVGSAFHESDVFDTQSLKTLAGKWLREDWLARAGNSWIGMARSPAVDQGTLPYPVLPVVTLGWKVKDTGEQYIAESAAAFGNGINRLIEALHSHVFTGSLQNVRKMIDATWDGKRGGSVTVPPVAGNGARPVWRFTETGMGWMSTDPEGLPLPEGEGTGALHSMEEPAQGHVSIVGGWHTSDAFVESVIRVLGDRAEMAINSGSLKGIGQQIDFDVVGRVGRDVLACFPKGSFSADVGVNEEAVRLFFHIAQGVEGNSARK